MQNSAFLESFKAMLEIVLYRGHESLHEQQFYRKHWYGVAWHVWQENASRLCDETRRRWIYLGGMNMGKHRLNQRIKKSWLAWCYPWPRPLVLATVGFLNGFSAENGARTLHNVNWNFVVVGYGSWKSGLNLDFSPALL